MNIVSRGIRNAFRNGTRTLGIVVILALSVGLALSMIVARSAVEAKIAAVKQSVGTDITISPAGFTPGSEANNALSTDDLAKVSSLTHVTKVTETLTDRLSTTGSSSSLGGMFGRAAGSGGTTSLTSPTTLDDSGGRRVFIGGGSSNESTDNSSDTLKNFSLPVSFLGTTDPSHVDSVAIQIESGKTISGSAAANDALVSSKMADKNNLKVGSTFTAYDKTLTVAGIFSTASENRGVENTVVLSLAALQGLSGQAGVVTSATATVDSLDNLSSATTAVKNALGSSADVTSSQEQADNTVKPLDSVKTVALYSLIGAIVAGAVIIFLTMMMIVRERRREIGVMKAIGSSNATTTGQFMVESVTLTVIGLLVGFVFTIFAAGPITSALVSSSSSSSEQTASSSTPGQGTRQGSGQGGFMRGPGAFGGVGREISQNIESVKTSVNLGTLGFGILAALLIAVIGSAVPAYFISKIRPSEVMRAE